MMNCTSLIIINCPLTFDKMTESGETFCQINYIKSDVVTPPMPQTCFFLRLEMVQ